LRATTPHHTPRARGTTPHHLAATRRGSNPRGTHTTPPRAHRLRRSTMNTGYAWTSRRDWRLFAYRHAKFPSIAALSSPSALWVRYCPCTAATTTTTPTLPLLPRYILLFCNTCCASGLVYILSLSDAAFILLCSFSLCLHSPSIAHCPTYIPTTTPHHTPPLFGRLPLMPHRKGIATTALFTFPTFKVYLVGDLPPCQTFIASSLVLNTRGLMVLEPLIPQHFCLPARTWPSCSCLLPPACRPTQPAILTLFQHLYMPLVIHEVRCSEHLRGTPGYIYFQLYLAYSRDWFSMRSPLLAACASAPPPHTPQHPIRPTHRLSAPNFAQHTRREQACCPSRARRTALAHGGQPAGCVSQCDISCNRVGLRRLPCAASPFSFRLLAVPAFAIPY